MKKGLIFTVMLVGVWVLGFAQAGRQTSNPYADTRWVYQAGNVSVTLSLTNNEWTMVNIVDGRTTNPAGTYTYSGNNIRFLSSNSVVATATVTNTIMLFRFSNADFDMQLTKQTSSGSQTSSREFQMNGTALVRYNGTATNVTIPAGVTSIGEDAFAYNTNLTSVTISSSVISIGDSAFFGCLLLTSVTIPSSVTSIGDTVFGMCASLRSITIPSSVTSIGGIVFFECYSLTNINVDAQNREFSSVDGVLFNKRGTELITYPAGKQRNYTIPSNVTSIGDFAFAYNSGLTSITIPSGVTSIGNFVFSDCGSLTNINVDAQNREFSSVDGVLFNKNRTVLITYPAGKQGNYTIPSSVTTIQRYAFCTCRNLTSVTIPSSVTLIGAGAFEKCVRLTSITIPSSVTTIGAGAFEESGLTSITIPPSVTRIYDEAFKGCANLRTVTVSRRTTLGANVFPTTARITYSDEGSGSTNDFEMNGTELVRYRGSAANVIIPAGVTFIRGGAFQDNRNLTNVTIPAGVTSIWYSAFNGCSSITSFTVNSQNSVYSSVEGVLFTKDRTELIKYPAGKQGNYTIPAGVTYIGDWAFYECTGITSVTIPSSVTGIGNSAFYQCSRLTSITIPSSVTIIGNGAFNGCSSLTSVTISRRTLILTDVFPSTARITYSD